MDYFIFSLLHTLMNLLSALAPMLVTTALFLILLEALRAERSDELKSENRHPESETAATSILVPRP